MALLRNKKTNQIINVPDNQLQSYGVSSSDQSPYQTGQQAFSGTQPQSNAPSPRLPGQSTQTMPSASGQQASTGFDWGNSDLVQQKRISAINSGIKPAEVDKYITQKQNDYATMQLAASGALDDKEWQALKKTNPMLALQIQQSGKAPATAAQSTKNTLIEGLKKKAEAVKNVIALGKAGKLTGEQYKTALGQVASDFNKQALFAKEDKVAGSALTAVELAQLGGGIIQIDSRTPNWLDNAIGNQPAPQPTVKDKENIINQKMDYILTGKPPAGKQKNGNDTGSFLGNALSDAKNIGNNILGAPANVANTAKMAFTDPNSQKRSQALSDLNPNNALLKMAMGYISNLNQDLGKPAEGGDILGRIGENIYQRPVGTALDLLPGFAGKLKGVPGRLPGAGGEAATGENWLQRGSRATADFINGAGSQDYVARNAGKSGALPQNQILMEEGILGRPTVTGKIQATSQALNKYGTQIGDAYKNSNIAYRGNQIKDLLDTGLKNAGWSEKDVSHIRQYIENQGNLDLNSGDSLIHSEQVWKAAQRLEQNPPKMLKSTENAASYKQLAQDTAKVLRTDLAAKIPELGPINARYSGLRDYMDKVLPGDSTGAKLSGEGLGMITGLVKGAGKGSVNYVLQAANSLRRDNRFKQGDWRPRK